MLSIFSTPQLLLLSMKDMNNAKLTSVDAPLFNGIMSDLFPGVDMPVIDYSKVGTMHSGECNAHFVRNKYCNSRILH